MVNKKISRILGPVFGVMSFMSTIGATEFSVLAGEKVQASSVTVENTAAIENTDYFINVNKSITQNGLKVTVDKVAGSKHKLKVIVKVESDKPLDKEKLDYLEELVTYGEENVGSVSTDFNNEKDNTLVITSELDNDEKEFPEKGTLRVDLVMPEYKLNVGIDAAVDLTEVFKNAMEKDISAKYKISNGDWTLAKLESSEMGTSVTYNVHRIGGDISDHISYLNAIMVLKIGDKMYKMRSSSSSSLGDGNSIITKGVFETEKANYETIKDQKSIGIIPLIYEGTRNDLDKAMKEYEEKSKKDVSTKDLVNNIRYASTFDFTDGTKGEIYNIERNNDTVKIYCKGASDKESLLLANSMHLSYEYTKDKNEFVFYDGDRNMSFYKDPKESLGYIVEFDNVEKDKALNLYIDKTIQYIDKFIVGDEIQVSK